MKRIIHVVGARPNFVKAAPVYRALEAVGGFEQKVIHTGQHYDPNLSAKVIEDVGLPIHTNLLTQDLAAMKAGLMTRIAYTDAVIVYGDVHSTLTAAMAAKELGKTLIHVEAGLRCGDWSMPEEVNRFVVDSAADVLFTTEPSADSNLRRELVAGHIVRAGNVLVDSIDYARPKIDTRRQTQFGLVTLHRPFNTDNESRLYAILDRLESIAEKVSLIWPKHPRVYIPSWKAKHFEIIPPQGYIDMLGYIHRARFVLTDSGGLQEEAAIIGVPCLTLRPSTERPLTLEYGNSLVDLTTMEDKVQEALFGGYDGKEDIPQVWDGHASDRIAKWLKDYL